MAGDHRVAAHSATGFEDNQARHVLETSRLKPRLQAGDLLVELEIGEMVPLVSKAGCDVLPHGRAGRRVGKQSWNTLLHGVAGLATRAPKRGLHDVALLDRHWLLE